METGSRRLSSKIYVERRPRTKKNTKSKLSALRNNAIAPKNTLMT